ncbi:aspartate--tRNA ligase [bacterium]|nr:aspartate--tRNA ligase [bacterium]
MKERIYIGDINKDKLGSKLILCGYVDSIRKMGSLLFLYLRDETGVLQVQFDKSNVSDQQFQSAEQLRDENIVMVKGILNLRPESQVKAGLAQGEYELNGSELNILVKGKVPPFELSVIDEINESLKGKYRYFELRSSGITKKIRFRNDLVRRIREYFYSRDYQELETPYLIKSTPEGARDFVVPSRNFKGKFYALPQSPQLLKQLLMGSGFERYFQLARCFRDEDLRADRQPEFTQLDVERAFTDEQEIYQEIENMFSYISEKMQLNIKTPFTRITYNDSMERYASDKPDLRNPLVIEDFSREFKVLPVNFIKDALEKGDRIRGIRVPAAYSRSASKKIEGILKNAGAQGSIFISRNEGEYSFTLAKFANSEFYGSLKLKEGESIFFQIGNSNEHILSFLRDYLGKENQLLTKGYEFLWVTDFPLFLYDEELKGYASAHHPFTVPAEGSDLDVEKDLAGILSRAYDLVLNGIELGSGSIRINMAELQKKVFQILGMDEKTQQDRFGFFLEALDYGLPPHGGIALGIGRTAIGLYGDGSLKDFILFPKTTTGNCLLTGSPSDVAQEQLDELGIGLSGDEV